MILARAKGFTLTELLMAVAVSSIIFAGLAAMYAQAFKDQAETLRQEQLQASATGTLVKLQRDLREATYLMTPAAGAGLSVQGVVVRGYKGCVYLGQNGGALGGTGGCPLGYQGVMPNPVQFWYLMCNGTAPLPAADLQLYYYESTNTGAGNPTCPAPAAWSGGSQVPLVVNPVFLRRATGGPPNMFSRTATSGSNESPFESLDVAFDVVFELNNLPGSLPVPPMTVITSLPVNDSWAQP